MNDVFLRILQRMVVIRETEEWIAKEIENGNVKCPCHLAVGQEATPSVLAEFLTKDDRVYGTHRSHNQYLAITDDVEGLLAEVLGKASGCSRGMGGSQHLINVNRGFGGSVPIVGGTIPIACGAALAMKLKHKKDISVAFFGDGATEEGVFHESMNIASTMHLPICFICENNLFASHLHILERQPDLSVCRYADAHKIRNKQLDGNSVKDLYLALEEVVSEIRKTGKPFFVEVMTYRWKGHVGYREDIDVGVKRKEDLNFWKERDPISRLLAENAFCHNNYDSIISSVRQRIKNGWRLAEKANYEAEEALLKYVYCD